MDTNPNQITIGCVADDFTGASDIASFMEKSGARCLLINGIPSNGFTLNGDYDAIVIALKIRNIQAKQAVQEAAESFRWLKRLGIKTMYYKYCSTFDSTPQGNIGPVLDYLLEQYQIPYTILCPALPVNRRTVKEGILYIDEIPLHLTGMANHPLNPMWESSIVKLMECQSMYPCYSLDYHMLEKSDTEIMEYIEQLEEKNEHFYLSVDYFEDKHGVRLSELFSGLPLLSGGSALPMHLIQYYATENVAYSERNTEGIKRGIILSGSCSAATSDQIHSFIRSGGISCMINPRNIIDGNQTIEDLWRIVEDNSTQDILFYSCDGDMDDYAERDNHIEASRILEDVFARLGIMAIKANIENIIVAGGETSGAVIQALKSKAFEIGESISPGVPILYPVGYPNLKIALKSGNFGQADFFARALSMMKRR